SLVHAEDEVDLVLLGDVIDLWTTITNPGEENAATAAAVDLYLPVLTPDQLSIALNKEKEKVEAITANHPIFFEALGMLLTRGADRRRVFYVPGNHDHSLVEETTLQKVIRNSILTPRVLENFEAHHPDKSHESREVLSGRIKFPSFY